MDKRLSGIDIANIAKLNGINVSISVRTDLSNMDPYDGFYVINMDGEDKKGHVTGTHWVCCVCKGNSALYFDSFGVPPPLEVMEFLSKRYSRWFENSWVCQLPSSSSCGLFVIQCMMHVKTKMASVGMGAAFEHFLAAFGEDKENNERILKEMRIRKPDGF